MEVWHMDTQTSQHLLGEFYSAAEEDTTEDSKKADKNPPFPRTTF